MADNRLPQVINELYRQIVCYQEKQKEARKLLPAPSQDKLLTELGANTTRTILASKNSDADQVVYEMGDLWYHCLVLLLTITSPPAKCWWKWQAGKWKKKNKQQIPVQPGGL